ncbi:hypothetical protein Bbelb_199060, partial [Branchiostoma belcheri]
EAPSEDERPLSDDTVHDKGRRKEGEGRCGLCCCVPDCLQVFNSPRWLLFFMCILCATEAAILIGLTPGVISTIEQRFEFSSAKSGFIVSSTDIFAAISVPVISYYGAKSHKVDMLSLVPTSPSLVAPFATIGRTEQPMNSATQTKGRNYLYVFIAAQLLMSFCPGPLYSVGVAYLDENVKKKVSGAYIVTTKPPTKLSNELNLGPDKRILYAVASAGPGLGYVIISLMLNQYIDWPEVNGYNSGLTPYDQRWLGNWWFGYFILASVAFLVAIPLFCYPQKLHGCPEAMVLVGIVTFAPKLGQTQLGLHPSESALYLGLMSLPAGAIGNLLGGWITKKAGADCKKLLKILLFISVLSLLGHCDFLLYCSTPGIATYLYSNSSTSCSRDCGCTDSLYDPICDKSGFEYQSGCHAGCTGINQTGPTKTYSNCSCIMGDWLFVNVTSGSGSEAVHGPCAGGCPGYIMPLFLTVFVLLALISTLVPESRRSFALGVQWTLARLLGMIPGPIVFGYIIDQACVLWQDSCGEVGACVVYDSSKLGLYMLAASVGIRLVSMALYIAAYCLYKPMAEEKTREKKRSPQS